MLMGVLLFTGCKKDNINDNPNTNLLCSDGIKNGDEVGIDCGGSCPDLCNSWIQKASFDIQGRDGAVGFSIGSKGYIGTGYQDVTPYSKDFWEYDPSTDIWLQKSDFGGGARTQSVGFSIGNKGYIVTGDDGVNPSPKDFWEYDPNSNSWVQKTNFGGRARRESAGFSIGNKGYISTGVDGTILLQDLWEYVP